MSKYFVVKASGANISIPILDEAPAKPYIPIKSKGYIPLTTETNTTGIKVKGRNGKAYRIAKITTTEMSSTYIGDYTSYKYVTSTLSVSQEETYATTTGKTTNNQDTTMYLFARPAYQLTLDTSIGGTPPHRTITITSSVSQREYVMPPFIIYSWYNQSSVNARYMEGTCSITCNDSLNIWFGYQRFTRLNSMSYSTSHLWITNTDIKVSSTTNSIESTSFLMNNEDLRDRCYVWYTATFDIAGSWYTQNASHATVNTSLTYGCEGKTITYHYFSGSKTFKYIGAKSSSISTSSYATIKSEPTGWPNCISVNIIPNVYMVNKSETIAFDITTYVISNYTTCTSYWTETIVV